jgi:hypothetical protein
VHQGPCLLARVNEQVDLFGGTLQRAASMAEGAPAGSVALEAGLTAHPGVAKVLPQPGVRTREPASPGSPVTVSLQPWEA